MRRTLTLVALAAACGGGSSPAIDTFLLTVPAEPFYEGSDATFFFAATEPGATFEARIDGAPFGPAAPPHTIRGLVRGRHLFEVRAVDRHGDADPTPARHSWEVLRAPGSGPTLLVDFPPPASATSADTIAVRGRASDPDGVAAVRVSGIEATSSDDFATWIAEIPVAPGVNQLVVEAEDRYGDLSVAPTFPVVTRRGPYLIFPLAPVLDAKHGRLLVPDDGRDAIVAVDLGTGERTVAAQMPVLLLTSLFAPVPLALDAAGDRLFVQHYHGTISVIPLATGTAEVLVPQDVMTTHGLWLARGITYDPAGDRLFISDDRDSMIHEIEVTTGGYRLVSSDPPATGHDSGVQTDLVWDAAHGRILVGDKRQHRIVAVDPSTGERTTLGGFVFNPQSLDLDVAANRLLAFGNTGDDIHLIDLADGTQTTIRPKFPAGSFNYWGGMAAATDSEHVYVTHTARNTIYRIDVAGPSPGSWTRLGADSVGSGLPLGGYENTGISGMTFDALRDRTLLALRVVRGGLVDDMILAVDRATGHREVLSSTATFYDDEQVAVPPRGSGPALDYVTDVAIDVRRDRILALDDFAGTLYAVDPGSGDRAPFTVSTPGPGADSRWRRMSLDTPGDRVLVTQLGRPYVSIDLETGTQTDVFVSSTPDLFLLMPGTNLLYGTTGGGLPKVVSIDLVSDTTAEIGTSVIRRRDLILDDVSNRLLTLHDFGIQAFDLAGLAAAEITDPTGRLGPSPPVPYRFCLDRERRCLQVMGSGLGSVRGLFTFDLVTGACVISSKE